jgi:hypothetical protein
VLDDIYTSSLLRLYNTMIWNPLILKLVNKSDVIEHDARYVRKWLCAEIFHVSVIPTEGSERRFSWNLCFLSIVAWEEYENLVGSKKCKHADDWTKVSYTAVLLMCNVQNIWKYIFRGRHYKRICMKFCQCLEVIFTIQCKYMTYRLF